MFSWKKQARFEVVVDQGGHSSIDGIFDDDRQAIERATYLLSLAKYSRVQVVQVGKHTQTVIFERASQAAGVKSSASPRSTRRISAPMCWMSTAIPAE